MSVFSKLAFWKKKDDLDFDNLAQKDLNLGLGEGGAPIQDNLGLGEKSPFGEPHQDLSHQQDPFAPQQPQTALPTKPTPTPPSGLGEGRDLELISSKLDTVKAILTSMDQRIANLEKAAGVDKSKERLW